MNKLNKLFVCALAILTIGTQSLNAMEKLDGNQTELLNPCSELYNDCEEKFEQYICEKENIAQTIVKFLENSEFFEKMIYSDGHRKEFKESAETLKKESGLIKLVIRKNTFDEVSDGKCEADEEFYSYTKTEVELKEKLDAEKKHLKH